MKIFGITGFSGSGKTVLIEQLIPLLCAKGLTVSVIKRAHHNFDVDKPGKDSWRHRAAGAHEVMVVSPERWALLRELRDAAEATLEELLARLSPCDLALVEGFKHAPLPKLEVYRVANDKPPLYPDNPYVVAVATDGPCAARVPVLDLNDPAAIVTFLLAYLGLETRQ